MTETFETPNITITLKKSGWILDTLKVEIKDVEVPNEAITRGLIEFVNAPNQVFAPGDVIEIGSDCSKHGLDGSTHTFFEEVDA